MKWKNHISKLSIFVIILVMTIVSSNLNWGKDHWKGILEADAKGYYAYLPAIFIYQDMNFGFFDSIEKEKYYDENLYYDYRAGANDKTINKYYCGTALAELPFFLVAHLVCSLSNQDADGYSKVYPVLISIAALFYLMLGLIFLNRTLNYYQINEWQKSLVLIATVFGTNVFYYTVGEPGMSHIFSFAFISMFIYYSHSYFTSYRKKHILILALLLGIITLIRPINGLIILILPFAAGNLNALKQGFMEYIKNFRMLIISIAAFIIIVSIQLIIYKISSDQFFVYSYSGEGFNFLKPHILDLLFSYKKGLFLYAPLLFLSLTGGYYLWKSSRLKFYSWAGFLIIITYIFSSWWMWFYGGSFSSRVFVEFIPLFMILLGISIKAIKPKVLNALYVTSVVLLIIVCQIQTYQYRYYQIHWADMTKEKYWDVFLRIDKIND